MPVCLKIFKDIINLDAEEVRVISKMITKKLFRNEKKAINIQTIIKISKDETRNCIEADETKFPDLIKSTKSYQEHLSH